MSNKITETEILDASIAAYPENNPTHTQAVCFKKGAEWALNKLSSTPVASVKGVEEAAQEYANNGNWEMFEDNLHTIRKDAFLDGVQYASQQQSVPLVSAFSNNDVTKIGGLIFQYTKLNGLDSPFKLAEFILDSLIPSSDKKKAEEIIEPHVKIIKSGFGTFPMVDKHNAIAAMHEFRNQQPAGESDIKEIIDYYSRNQYKDEMDGEEMVIISKNNLVECLNRKIFPTIESKAVGMEVKSIKNFMQSISITNKQADCVGRDYARGLNDGLYRVSEFLDTISSTPSTSTDAGSEKINQSAFDYANAHSPSEDVHDDIIKAFIAGRASSLSISEEQKNTWTCAMDELKKQLQVKIAHYYNNCNTDEDREATNKEIMDLKLLINIFNDAKKDNTVSEGKEEKKCTHNYPLKVEGESWECLNCKEIIN